MAGVEVEGAVVVIAVAGGGVVVVATVVAAVVVVDDVVVDTKVLKPFGILHKAINYFFTHVKV